MPSPLASFPARLVWGVDTQQFLGLHLWQPALPVMFAFAAVCGERGWVTGGMSERLYRGCGAATAAGVVAVAVLAVTLGGDAAPFRGG